MDSAFQCASVFGQQYVQSSPRAPNATARAQESNDKAETITRGENMVIECVGDRASEEAKGC